MANKTHDIKIYLQIDWEDCPDTPRITGYRSLAIIERGDSQESFGLPPEIGLAIIQILQADSVEVRENPPESDPPIPDNVVPLKQ